MRLSIIRFVIILLLPMFCFASDNSLFIDNPEALKKLEVGGYSINKWFSLSDKNTALNNLELYNKSVGYKAIVDSISEELDAIAAKDPLASVTMAKSHRLFDKRWLRSSAAHYELVGVINRMDRKDFHPETCGELRFIYRLAYRINQNKHTIQSRLPLTINVASFLPKGNCSAFAIQWREFDKIKNQKLKTIELNLQAVRWPSAVRPDMGGYAEYFLRVFVPTENSFVEGLLENTPDFETLSKNKALRSELLQWIVQPKQLESLDNGTILLPEKYLTHKATSVALHGRTRDFNKPFSRLYKESDFNINDFTGYRSFKSSYALLKRLNDMSCVGCHQGRTVAGFHFLGQDRSEVSPVNSILSSFSSHFLNDQKRRQDYIGALSKSISPNSYRPFSIRSPHEKGLWGSHCSTGKDLSFIDWTCEENLTCKAYDLEKNSPLGTCVEVSTATEGSPCKVGTYRNQSNPHKDQIENQKNLKCRADLICEETSVGFPGGMCSGDCSKLGPHATCGSIAILFGFNQCLSKGRPFESCLINNVRPGSLRSCDLKTPCRDDYICAKTKSGSGGCIPPYFLFQLRVDGHPTPI